MRSFVLRRVAVVAVATLVLPGLTVAVDLATAAPAAAACTAHPGDINNDGFGDAVIGQPLRFVSGKRGAGAVSLLFNGAGGLGGDSGSQYTDESMVGTLDTPDDTDNFGMTTAVGNFNGDCFADVAVGVPFDNADEGSVFIFYGSAAGAVLGAPVRFRGSQFGTAGFGASLAVGDYNADGTPDLAIGAPFSNSQEGAVIVLIGSQTGLQTTGARIYSQDTPGVPGTGEANDEFGWSLAAGDFTGDGATDLAIDTVFESVGNIGSAGSVTVLHGSPGNLIAAGSQLFDENTAGVPGTAESGDEWGWSLAAGDITGDGKADLLIGVPFEDLGSTRNAGSVTMLKGASAGLTTSGAQNWTQNSSGVPGTAEASDEFGWALAVGDFNSDGHADAAIGAPGEALGTVPGAGTVDVLYGRSTGLTGSGATAWSQNTTGIAGTGEPGDNFGNLLQAVLPDDSLPAEIVVGVPGEDTGGLDGNGAIAVLHGGSHGITATGNEFIDGTDLAGGAVSGAGLGMSHPF